VEGGRSLVKGLKIGKKPIDTNYQLVAVKSRDGKDKAREMIRRVRWLRWWR
jgi:hypothetical protein